MSYNSVEQSINQSAPVECYRFVGSFREYLYTSADRQVQLGGRTYLPAAIRRESLRAGTQDDDNLALEIQLPFDTTVVRDYAYADSPPALRLEMYRSHRGLNMSSDFVLLWRGEVVSFNVDGRIASLVIPSVFARLLQGDVPSAFWQAPCNHVLFDTRCGLSRSTYSTTTSVVLVAGREIQVADQEFSNAFLVGGEMVNQRNGERRMITSNEDNLIEVRVNFVDMRVGDTVELTAGCDHSFATCKAKFDNGLRYGGHPFIPSDNPFEGEI